MKKFVKWEIPHSNERDSEKGLWQSLGGILGFSGNAGSSQDAQSIVSILPLPVDEESLSGEVLILSPRTLCAYSVSLESQKKLWQLDLRTLAPVPFHFENVQALQISATHKEIILLLAFSPPGSKISYSLAFLSASRRSTEGPALLRTCALDEFVDSNPSNVRIDVAEVYSTFQPENCIYRIVPFRLSKS